MHFINHLKHSTNSLKNKISLFTFIILPFSALSQVEKYSHIYDSDEIISKGVELYASEKYSEAIKEYDKILKPDTDYLKAQYEKILALSALDKKAELEELFQKLYASGSMTQYPDLLVLYGSHMSDKEEFAQAEKLFLEAEKLLPYSSIVSYNIAIVYIRMENRQKAIDYLKKTLIHNPNYSSAHYVLGLIAYESGRIVEGSLAMLGYLTLTPAGKFSTEAVLKLNTKMGQDFLKKDNLIYSSSGDNFSELELILRNQLPLNQKYKAIATIDDVVTRQIQAIMEYAPTHQVKDGFFENIYIPYLADIQKKKLTEDFIYYSLISFEEKLGKKLTTHKKKIIDFSQKYVGGEMWELFGKRKLEHFGRTEEVVVYLENNFPSMIGKTIDGKAQGKYKLVNKHGQLLAELNYKDNELEGLQTYYYANGKKSNSLHFAKGIKLGEFKEYYTNGSIQSEGTYKNGEVDGKYIFYYPNGGKQCERTFKNGLIEGASVCYYPSGQIQNEYPYVNGKLNGKVTEYNQVGAITQTATYIDDLYDGEVVVYFDGTKINSKVTYQKGVPIGTYLEYYENGQLYRESTFENGNIKKSTEYFANGKIVGESFYDSKGQLEKQIYYDEKSEKYFEERFKGGKTKVGYQYTSNNNQPVEVPLKKDLYEMKDLNGTLRISGYYSKGTMNGPWTYYKSNGKINFIQNYQNDKIEGLRYDYDEQEKVSSTYYQSEGGVLNGLFEGFRNDQLSVKMYFYDGQRHGPYQYFYKNGTISYEGYYINGRNYLSHYTYNQSGKPLREFEYIDNYVVRIKNFNPDSSIGYEIDLANKTQKIDILENQGLVITSVDYKNGVRNGKSITKIKNGELVSNIEITNDVYHGKYNYYHPTGKPSLEANYYSGKVNGTSKFYDLNGKLRLSTEEAFGKEFGKVTRYYENGQKIYEYNSLNEVKDGEQIFYNQVGKPIAAIGFANDVIQYYKVLDKSGNLGEAQKTIPTSDYQIVSTYPDGKNAFKLHLTKGYFDKKLEINSENGQPVYYSEFNMGKLHGKRIEYFKNGKIYKSEYLDDNRYQGIQEYFSEDGKLIISAPFSFDELHGELKVFENGKMVKQRIYDSNELVEIKL